jgi:CshA-type fibril repeat protein
MCHAAPVPTANPDISSAGKNVAQTKDLLANDEVATNSSGVTLVASSVKLCDVSPLEVSPNCTKGAGSTISVANVGTYSVDASGVVTFTPVLDYLGTPPALNYQVEDSVGNIATSTYTPTVLDTLPTANNDTSSGPYNTNQIIDAVANDTAGSLYALNKASVKLCAVGTADNACLATVLDVPNEGIYSSNQMEQ